MFTKESIAKLWSEVPCDNAANRILVVDDDPQLSELIIRWLSSSNYDCLRARSAEEALEILASERVALVLSDIVMPKKSGIQLLEEVHLSHPEIAFVLISALDDRQTAADAIKIGASGYLIKPLKHQDVMINVASALERRRLMLESMHYEHFLEAEVRDRTAAMRRNEEEIVLRLVSALEFRDLETGAHIRRIGMYSAEIARTLGWHPKAIDQLNLAAMMHDVGKIGVPDQILGKPGKLTTEEFAIIKTHTTIGAAILGGSDIPVLKLAAEIALSHHERWDGTGYPNGQARRMIPEAARIVALVDFYDALTSERPYKPAWPEEKALQTIREGRGKHFDPILVDLFIDLHPAMQTIRTEFSDAASSPKFQRSEPLARIPKPSSLLCSGAKSATSTPTTADEVPGIEAPSARAGSPDCEPVLP